MQNHFIPIVGAVLISLLFFSEIATADQPVLPKAKGEFCVEPTEVMRTQHMDFLLHQRDQTVYNGIRTKKHSLKECIDCHVQTNDNNEFIPINAPDQFCSSCHEFASVKLDCFECHRTTPDDNQAALNALKENKLTAMSFLSNKPNDKYHQSINQQRQLIEQLLTE